MFWDRRTIQLRGKLKLEPVFDFDESLAAVPDIDLQDAVERGDLAAMTTLASRFERRHYLHWSSRLWDLAAKKGSGVAYTNLGIHAFECQNEFLAAAYWLEAEACGCPVGIHNAQVMREFDEFRINGVGIFN